MSSIIEKKLRLLKSDYVTASELAGFMSLSENACHAQIKRALKQGVLVRLKRGVYRRGGYLEKNSPHLFELSHYLMWPSYVSLESALSYHGLIPEAVYVTTCVTTKRASSVKNIFGVFNYKTVPKIEFFTQVQRVEEEAYCYYVAKPWKALCDYVYCYKKNWCSLIPLISSLRIDENELPTLSEDESNELSAYYHSRRVDLFLRGVLSEY
tara:strand:+ start:18718 stop:19347 length:630 start_codon:yes stop_codon:yes gene_type:complete